MVNKKRLIDANALKDALRTDEGAKALGHSVYKLFAVDEIIDQIPTVDAVEVVRCKNCDVPHNRWTGCPNLNGLVPPPNFYCPYGERREGE